LTWGIYVGFSNLFAAALAFSVLLGIFYVLYDRLPKQVVDLDTQITGRWDDLASRAATEMNVENVTYYSDSHLTVSCITNSGTSILDPDDLSVILDGLYLDQSTYTILWKIDGDNVNPDLWDPDEVLMVNISLVLEEGEHRLKFFYSNGVYVVENFQVINPDVTWPANHSDAVEGSVNASSDITWIGAGEDSDYIYLRMNLSGDLSEGGIYAWCIDLDGDRNTGIATDGQRTLVGYPSGTTQTFSQGAGVEYLVVYRKGEGRIFGKEEFASTFQEENEATVSRPSPSSLILRLERSDLGFSSGQSVSFWFYAYSLDALRRTDYAPDP